MDIIRPSIGERDAAPLRIICQTSSRPLRVVAVIESDGSGVFRRTVRLLCSMWGGTNSLIVTGSEGEPIHARWTRAVRAFDPDVVIFQASRRRSARASNLREKVDELGVTPIWVVPLTDELELQLGWTPVRTAQLDVDTGWSRSANRIHGATAVEVAVLGLSNELAGDRSASASLRRLAAVNSLVPDSPVAGAALGISRIRARPLGSTPFLYYTRPSTEVGRALWNMRALHGSVAHGGDIRLESYIDEIRARGRQRLTLVHVDDVSARGLAALGAIRKSTVMPLARATWPRRWYRPLGGRADSEIEDVPLIEGTAQIPRRPPAFRTPAGTVEITDSRGVYALEVDLMFAGRDRKVSLPPRPGLTNALVARSAGLISAQLASFTTASRVAQGPTIVIAVRPGRWGRTIPVRIPSLTETFSRLGSVQFSVSDKGHFARWLSKRLDGVGGIHALLTDVRGRAISREFLTHHLGGTSTGAYRRSLTITEMREVFRQQRQAGVLPRRLPVPDDPWLQNWLEWLVRSDVLKLGVRVKCAECLWGSLVTLGMFGETFNCPRCGTADLVPATPTLAYQLAEAAHQFLVNRSDVTALALGALQQRSRASFSGDFDHEVRMSDGSVREIDLVAVTDGNIVIGESKSNGKFDAGDFALMRRLAADIQPRLIAFATDRECDGGCGPACSRPRSLPASSDSALPSGAPGGIGPRERLAALRRDVWRHRTHVIAMCRGELIRPWDVTRAEFII